MQPYHRSNESIHRNNDLITIHLFYTWWRRLFTALLVVVCFAILVSCEKEIDLDLKGVESKYVIEAVLTDQVEGCKVLISKTKDFKEDNSRITVSGANVVMAQGNDRFELQEVTPGVYEHPTLKGETGKTYQLEVNIDNQVFTATSTMPALVSMDSLYISEEFVIDKTYKLPTIDFLDPASITNNYRFLVYVNGVKKKQLFTINDELSDGQANSIRLYLHVGEDEDNPENKRIESGDLLKVEMLNIDYPVYKYFFSLENSATGESQSATPANPVSNIKGGALGYFSVHTLQSKEIRVP